MALIYSELGYQKECEEDTNQGNGGSYLQFTLNLTDVPLQIPTSLCLPKECGKAEYFAPLMEQANTVANNLLQVAQKHIDFDGLYSKVSNTSRLSALEK
jgi:hypothetical protein